jgi:hypothetical protein
MPELIDWQFIAEPYERPEDNWPSSLTVTELAEAGLDDVYLMWIIAQGEPVGANAVASWNVPNDWTLVEYRATGSGTISSGRISMWCYAGIAGQTSFPFTLEPRTQTNTLAPRTWPNQAWAVVLAAYSATSRLADGYYYYTSSNNIARLTSSTSAPYTFPVPLEDTAITAAAATQTLSFTSYTAELALRPNSGFTERIHQQGIGRAWFSNSLYKDGTLYGKGFVGRSNNGVRSFDTTTWLENAAAVVLNETPSTGVTKLIEGSDGAFYSLGYTTGTAAYRVSQIDIDNSLVTSSIITTAEGVIYGFGEGFGSYWIPNRNSTTGVTTVKRLDKSTGALQATIDVTAFGSTVGGFITLGSSMLVLHQEQLSLIDPITNTASLVSSGSNSVYLSSKAQFANWLYLGYNQSSTFGTRYGRIRLLDTTTNTFTATPNAPLRAQYMSVSPDGNSLWAVCVASNDGYVFAANIWQYYVKADITNKEKINLIMGWTPYAIAGFDDATPTFEELFFSAVHATSNNDAILLLENSYNSSGSVATIKEDLASVSSTSLGPTDYTNFSANTNVTSANVVGYIEDPILGNSIWVGGTNLVRLDPNNLTRQEFISVNGNVTAMAYDHNLAAPALWYTNATANVIGKWDMTTRSIVASVATGTTPSKMAYGANSVWVSHDVGNTVVRVNPATNSVVATIVCPQPVTEMIYAANFLWAANGTTGQIYKISPSTNTIVATITPATNVSALEYDGSKIWVTDRSSTTRAIWTINPSTNAVTKRTANAFLSTGNHELSWDGTAMWLSDQLLMKKINATTYAVDATVSPINPTGGVTDMTHMLGRVYAATNQNTVTQVNASTASVTNSIVTNSVTSQYRSLDSAVAYGWVWHLRIAGSSIELLKIDPANGNIVSTPWRTPTNTGVQGGVGGGTLLAEGGEVWVVTTGTGLYFPVGFLIARVSPTNNNVTTFPYTLPTMPQSLAWTGGSLWILTQRKTYNGPTPAKLFRINPNTGAATEIPIVENTAVTDNNRPVWLSVGFGYLWVTHANAVFTTGQITTNGVYKYSVASGSYQKLEISGINQTVPSGTGLRGIGAVTCGQTGLFIPFSVGGGAGVSDAFDYTDLYDPTTGAFIDNLGRYVYSFTETSDHIFAHFAVDDRVYSPVYGIVRYDKNRTSGKVKPTHLLFSSKRLSEVVTDNMGLYGFYSYSGDSGQIYTKWDFANLDFSYIQPRNFTSQGENKPEFSLIDRDYPVVSAPTAIPEWTASPVSVGNVVQVEGDTGNDPVFGYFTG